MMYSIYPQTSLYSDLWEELKHSVSAERGTVPVLVNKEVKFRNPCSSNSKVFSAIGIILQRIGLATDRLHGGLDERHCVLFFDLKMISLRSPSRYAWYSRSLDSFSQTRHLSNICSRTYATAPPRIDEVLYCHHMLQVVKLTSSLAFSFGGPRFMTFMLRMGRGWCRLRVGPCLCLMEILAKVCLSSRSIFFRPR